MADLYPEPPHLTVAIYPGQPEEHCFATLCMVIERLGCVPGNAVETAPWDASFELRSDLAGISSVLKVAPNRFAGVVAGVDGGRPIRAGYRHEKNGIILVEYLAAPTGSRHPIAVSFSAKELGIPSELWSKGDRKAARRLANWSKSILLEMTLQCAVSYGAVGVEYSLPTPSELKNGNGLLPSELFVSKHVLQSHPEIRSTISQDFLDADISEWPTGLFCSGWTPFNDRRATLPQDRIHPKKSGLLLGRALVE